MQLRKLGRHWRIFSAPSPAPSTACSRCSWPPTCAGPSSTAPAAKNGCWPTAHLLKDVQREAFGNFLDIVCLIERQRECLRRKIIFANRDPKFASLIGILKSVPGIDEIWACIIAAEIGDFPVSPTPTPWSSGRE